jgi:uncharacterized protein YeaO (DUF488 family)
MVSSRIALKRVYDEPSDLDGFRVLVDRLWPRGLTKAAAHIDLWLRDLAPSNDLRKWYHAHPEHWKEFRQKYLAELHSPAAEKALQQLYDILDSERAVTLLFASKQTAQNNATVLKEFVEGMKKPPKGTGDQRARAQKRRRM